MASGKRHGGRLKEITMDKLRFEGRVAIVTGAGHGMGRTHARLLAKRGAQVVVNDYAMPDKQGARLADKVVEEIRAAGGVAVADYGDISSQGDVDVLVDETVRAFGRVDILINNAAVNDWVMFDEMTERDFLRQVDVNLVGTFRVARAVWTHMRRQNYGRIVLTTSGGFFGAAGNAHYGATKGGVIGLGLALSQEGRPCGINVNMLSPMAQTRQPQEFAESDQGTLYAEMNAAFAAYDASPDIVSPAAVWLCHEECKTTGAIIHSGMGWNSRIGFMCGKGWPATEPNPEALRQNWATVENMSELLPISSAEDLLKLSLSKAPRKTG